MNDHHLSLACRIREGARPVGDLIAAMGTRQAALAAYVEAMQSMFGPRGIQGVCEACEHRRASVQRAYTWRAVISYEVGKSAAKAFLLLSSVLAVSTLSALTLPDGETEIRDIRFQTIHNLCDRCSRRIRRNSLVGGLIMFFLGIPMVLAFGSMVILFFVSLLCAFSGLDLSPHYLLYTVPGLLGALVLVILFRVGVVRLPALLTTPAAIRRIENGGFRAFNGSGTGSIT